MSGHQIFMTGGTGLIGRWTTASLSQQGHEIFILTRNAAARTKSFKAWINDHDGDGEKITLLEGDLGKPGLGLSSKDRARLDRVRWVYHLGASFEWNLDKTFARKINVTGTAETLKLAQALSSLDRFILVSGYMVAAADRWSPFGLEKPDGIKPMAVSDRQLGQMYKKLGAYEASKLEADLLTRRICAEQNLPLTVINPATVIGHSQTGELDQSQGIASIIQSIWKNLFTAIPGQKADWVPLITIDYLSQFLAKAPALAETKDAEFTLLDPATPRLDELTELIARHLGRAPAKRHLPKSLMQFLLNAGLDKIMGSSAESLSFIEPYYFDTAPAEEIGRKLGLEKPSLHQAIRRTTDQLVANQFGQITAAHPAGTYRYEEIAGSRTLLAGSTTQADHVFLHGLPLTADSWTPLLDKLPCRPLFADIPGVSRSARRFEIAPADWTAALCHQLTEPPVLIAHSLGTAYALDYANQYPARLKALILIAPYFLQKPAAKSLKLSFSKADVTALLSDQRAAPETLIEGTFQNFKNPGMKWQAGKILGQTRKAAHRQHYQALLQVAQMPVLILTGTEDPLIEAAGGHPITEINGAGHYPQITHPQEVTQLIQEFTKALGSTAEPMKTRQKQTA